MLGWKSRKAHWRVSVVASFACRVAGSPCSRRHAPVGPMAYVFSFEPPHPASSAAPRTAPMTRRCLCLAVPARTTAPAASAAAVAPRRTLRAFARRCVLRPLDQLVWLDERSVLVLRDELEADPAALLVDLLDDDVERVAARDHVLDVADPARADVGDVQEPVRALLQLDEGAEVGRLHDLAGVGVPYLGLLRDRLDRLDRVSRLHAVGGVDEDRAVLLDIDLHLVVALEPTDRLATFADDHPDLLGIDLDRGDPRRVLCELGARLGDRLGHLAEDKLARALRLLERVPHDLLRDAGDLDVHLERGD